MRVEETEDGNAEFGSKFSKGIVIFPDNKEDIKTLKKLKEFLNESYG